MPETSDPMPAKGQRPTNLVFGDGDGLPDVREANQMSNPFQDAVNELATALRERGETKSKYVTVNTEKDMNWARNQIRRAASNIDLGSKTKVIANGDSYTVHFIVRNKD